MRRIALALCVVVALTACGDVSAKASVENGSPRPVAVLFAAKDLAAGRAFLQSHPKSDQVGGHEFDGYVLAAGRQNAKANSLRVTLLDRDANIWVVTPLGDTLADTIAAWIGKGDWVICHVHDRDGFTSDAWVARDLRLVAKAGA